MIKAYWVRENLKSIIFLFLILFLTLFIAETSLRLYEKFFEHVPFSRSPKDFYEPLLGWEGKKVWGDPSGKKYKILVIGDSFTDGMGVPEENMYYRVLAGRLGADLFIYGGVGYGTLQEYLVLEKYYDQLHPDLVILQTYSNDFINNSWELESRSFRNNNQMIRPYWRNGKIEYLYPCAWGRQKFILSSYSRLFYRIFHSLQKWYTLLAKKHYFAMHTVEDIIEGEGGANFKDFRVSVNTTELLMRKIKDKAAQTPVIAFATDNIEPYFKMFDEIFKRSHITFIDGLPALLVHNENLGVSLFLKNGHWNKAGHKIVGDFLAGEVYRLERKGRTSNGG